MKFIAILFLFIVPGACYATTGLGGMVIFLYPVYAVISAIILFLHSSLDSFIPKKSHGEGEIYYLTTETALVVLGLTVPLYYYAASISQVFYGLCVLHLVLAILVLSRFVKNRSLRMKLTVSYIVIAVGLAFFTPQMVNVYKYVPIENNPLEGAQQVLANHPDKIVELEDGLYRQHSISQELKAGRLVELRRYGEKFQVWVKTRSYYYEPREGATVAPIIKNYLFNIPIFKKEYNRYSKLSLPGYLTRVDIDNKK